MDPAEVLALEIEQFVGSGLKTLVPRIVGQTAEAQRRKGASASSSRQWDDASFFATLEIRAPQAVQVARDVQAWTMENGARIWFGRGKRDGSMIPVFTHAAVHITCSPPGRTYGAVEIYFSRLKAQPPFDDERKRLELLRRLNEIPGVAIPPDGIGRRPSIRLETLAAPEHTQRFLEVLAWTLQEIRAVPPVQDAQ